MPPAPKKSGTFKPWMAYVGGGVILVYYFMVRRSAASSAAASQQQQAYPVNTSFPPDNSQTSGVTALLALLSSGGGAPGSVVSTGASNSPPSFYPITRAQAQLMMKQGGTPYYSPAAGLYLPSRDLSLVGTGTQLYGSSLLSKVPAGTSGTPG